MAFAAARGIDLTFQAWQGTVRVPSLLWYPPFTQFAGPVAPPVPNVPTPPIAISPTGTTLLSAFKFKLSMVAAAVGQIDPATADEVMGAIAQQLEPFFSNALTATMVTNEMGSGAVPNSAPPAIPAGPVIGVANPTPGGMQ